MSKTNTPVITSNSKGEDWTKITFKPDLHKFGMTHMDEDFEALLKRRVYDMCGSIKDVKVWLNGERLKIKDFKQYIDLYLENVNPKPPVIYERVNDRWEVGFAVSEGQFQQVSFVNSIFTSKGGTHTNYVADQLVGKIQEAAQKKNKNGAPLKPFQIKSHMWLFVNCLIENPTFDSQTKENMTLRASSFGSKCPISEDFVKKVLKSGIIDSVLSLAKYKQEQQMKKTDGSKKSRISGIAKLDDANNAGTKNAGRCTLILTEGDSAKALAVSGLSVVGRDDFGVFPLRGKLLNVREANAKQLLENQEIQHIKQILGLQQGKKYDDASSLRYGHLMIMTDQDHDGSHIKGLIINFLDHFWPSLLGVRGFLQEFITPIVKVSLFCDEAGSWMFLILPSRSSFKATKGKGKDKKEVSFFTLPEYQKWRETHENGKGWNIKYYKVGLGLSRRDCFSLV
jgi:DNA topoisomerase-2